MNEDTLAKIAQAGSATPEELSELLTLARELQKLKGGE